MLKSPSKPTLAKNILSSPQKPSPLQVHHTEFQRSPSSEIETKYTESRSADIVLPTLNSGYAGRNSSKKGKLSLVENFKQSAYLTPENETPIQRDFLSKYRQTNPVDNKMGKWGSVHDISGGKKAMDLEYADLTDSIKNIKSMKASPLSVEHKKVRSKQPSKSNIFKDIAEQHLVSMPAKKGSQNSSLKSENQIASSKIFDKPNFMVNPDYHAPGSKILDKQTPRQKVDHLIASSKNLDKYSHLAKLNSQTPNSKVTEKSIIKNTDSSIMIGRIVDRKVSEPPKRIATQRRNDDREPRLGTEMAIPQTEKSERGEEEAGGKNVQKDKRRNSLRKQMFMDIKRRRVCLMHYSGSLLLGRRRVEYCRV